MRGKKRVVVEETPPTDFTKNNPSITIAYSGDDIDYIEKTIDGVTYRKTFTYTGGNLTGISEWVEQ